MELPKEIHVMRISEKHFPENGEFSPFEKGQGSALPGCLCSCACATAMSMLNHVLSET